MGMTVGSRDVAVRAPRDDRGGSVARAVAESVASLVRWTWTLLGAHNDGGARERYVSEARDVHDAERRERAWDRGGFAGGD